MLRKAIRLVFAFLVGGVTVLAVLAASGFVVAGISRVTKAGLLGICGPYGSDGAIYSMLAVLLAGLIAGVWLGVLTGRRCFRWGATHVPTN